MKRLIGVVGFLAGLLLGGALLLLNPISLLQGQPVALAGAVRTFTWANSDFTGMPLTPGGLLGLADAGPRGFGDPGIRHARAEVVVLIEGPGDPPVLGVRFSGLPPQRELIRARLGVATAWNLLWPDRGSLQLAGSENLWGPLRDGAWSAVRGRGFTPGGSRYPLPPLPGAGPPALIAGTGQFATVRGVFREEFSPAPEAPDDFTGLRQLHLAIE
jgi:hypothetical protein